MLPASSSSCCGTHLLLRPALTAAVAIAESLLDRTQSAGTKLIFYPFLPWPWPNVIGAQFVEGDPDTLWLMPRELRNCAVID
jgi:hypothetical protein